MSQYPKAVYLDGWTNLGSYRRVNDAVEEEIARGEGYKTLPEFPHPDAKPEPVMLPSAANNAAREQMAEIKPDRFAAARAAKATKRG